LIERTGIVDHEVGSFDFFRFWQLRGHAAGDFFAGGFEVEFLAGGEAGYALFFAAAHYDQAVELFGGAGFED
jgi:hypothetical protein